MLAFVIVNQELSMKGSRFGPVHIIVEACEE